MSYEPSIPPASLQTEIVKILNKSTPKHLRDVATYTEALAEHKECATGSGGKARR
jgi:hypothetical protein